MWCVARFGTFCTNLKNVKNIHGGVLIFSKVAGLKPATLLKLTLLHGCVSRFLNYTNGTKSRNASHLGPCQTSMITFFGKNSEGLKLFSQKISG